MRSAANRPRAVVLISACFVARSLAELAGGTLSRREALAELLAPEELEAFCAELDAVFTGAESHAALEPETGRSALLGAATAALAFAIEAAGDYGSLAERGKTGALGQGVVKVLREAGHRCRISRPTPGSASPGPMRPCRALSRPCCT